MRISQDRANSELISALSKRTDAAGHAAQKAMLLAVQDDVAPAIRTLAVAKAPRLWNFLRNSGRDYAIRTGARVAFGGVASAYAARQHEDVSMRRRGPFAGRAYKWVYGGTGVRSSIGKAGDWNEPKRVPGTPQQLAAHRARVTAWANRITRRKPFYGGAQGAGLIEWSGARWRFKKASYAFRDSSYNHPKVGQAHFLHGAPNSALEENRSWMLKHLAERGFRAYQTALARGNN